MEGIGKLLVLVGVIFVLVGAALWAGFGKGWLGRLPGDISIEKGGSTFYFPIVTCLLISIVLSLLLNIFRR
jgi:uncharacterized protein YybS (DUF2232 family)